MAKEAEDDLVSLGTKTGKSKGKAKQKAYMTIK